MKKSFSQSPIGQGGVDFVHAAFRVLTKYRKNEALIRNDGVYVISGIFCGAHEGRAQCAKQASVPSKGVQAVRAQQDDHYELRMRTKAARCARNRLK